MSKNRKFQWLEAYCYNGDSSTPRAVMMTMFHHADANTLTCHPTVERLAQACGLSERQVRRQIEANERSGWLTTVRHASNTRKSAPMYAEYELTFGQPRTNMSVDRSVNELEAGVDGHICHEDDPFADKYDHALGHICPPNRSISIDQRLIDQPLDVVDTSVLDGQICPPADSALGGALSEDHCPASIEIDQRSARTNMSVHSDDPWGNLEPVRVVEPEPESVAEPVRPKPVPKPDCCDRLPFCSCPQEATADPE